MNSANACATFVLSADSMLDPDHGIAAKQWDKVLT